MTIEKRKVAVLVNYAANKGRARKRWIKIREEVIKLLPEKTIIIPFEPPFDTKNCLKDLIEKQKVKYIISAGGDGSVNFILNELMTFENINLKEIFLGGIGLGSSNDFVKPKKQFIQNIPMRLNFNKAILADVGKVTFTKKNGTNSSQHFIANASLGVTAEANLLFNESNGLILLLKDKLTNLAIIYTALKTIVKFKNFQIDIKYNGFDKQIRLSNLAILKNPHVSGNFKYDQNIQPDDGKFGLNICENMTTLELVKTLIDLSKGYFSGKPKRYSIYTKNVLIKTLGLVALETDGEVLLGKDFHFSILPKTIGLLGIT